VAKEVTTDELSEFENIPDETAGTKTESAKSLDLSSKEEIDDLESIKRDNEDLFIDQQKRKVNFLLKNQVKVISSLKSLLTKILRSQKIQKSKKQWVQRCLK